MMSLARTVWPLVYHVGAALTILLGVVWPLSGKFFLVLWRKGQRDYYVCYGVVGSFEYKVPGRGNRFDHYWVGVFNLKYPPKAYHLIWKPVNYESRRMRRLELPLWIPWLCALVVMVVSWSLGG